MQLMAEKKLSKAKMISKLLEIANRLEKEDHADLSQELHEIALALAEETK